MSRRLPGLINSNWLAERTYEDGFANVPSAPRHGQLHFPAGSSSDPEWAYYDENYDDWLSLSRYSVFGKQFGSSSTVQGMHMDYGGATIWRYGGAVGFSFAYDVRLVNFAAHFVSSSTATLQVYAGGAAKTNATLVCSAVTDEQTDGYTTVTKINKGTPIGLFLVSGTITGGCLATATFARVIT